MKVQAIYLCVIVLWGINIAPEYRKYIEGTQEVQLDVLRKDCTFNLHSVSWGWGAIQRSTETLYYYQCSLSLTWLPEPNFGLLRVRQLFSPHGTKKWSLSLRISLLTHLFQCTLSLSTENIRKPSRFLMFSWRSRVVNKERIG